MCFETILLSVSIVKLKGRFFIIGLILPLTWSSIHKKWVVRPITSLPFLITPLKRILNSAQFGWWIKCMLIVTVQGV